MLVKGRASASEPAQFKMGYVNLAVATTEKDLNVRITQDKPQYAPGDKATFGISAKTSKGEPVAAEFSLALVDKAVETLATDNSRPLLQAFYGQRGLSVQTAGSLMGSVERLNQTGQADAKGGGGGGGGGEGPGGGRQFRGM